MATAQVITTSMPTTTVSRTLDRSEKLADSPFTVDWLLEALNENDEKFQVSVAQHEVAKVRAVDISQGKGFLSKVYKVNIEFDGVDHPYEVILKVPGLESLKGATSDLVDDDELMTPEKIAPLHNRECEFYRKYAPLIDIPMVKVFKAIDWVVGKHPGAILMESLVQSSSSSPLWTGCNPQQMYTVARHMATLTKHFLCLDPAEWVDKYPCELFNSIGRSNLFPAFMDKLKELKPGTLDQGVDAMRPYVLSPKFYTYTLFECAEDLGIPPVLSHGDLWANNMLWKRNADGSAANELAAIIDWQIIHRGSVASDLARFITMCCDGEVRREHEYKVLQYYYDQIVQLMEKDDRKVGFSYDQLKRVYNANYIHQTVSLSMMGPFLFNESEVKTPVIRARLDKILLRAELAIEDALERLKDMPEDKILS